MKTKIAPAAKGVKKFTIDGVTVNAINMQNAARKVRNVKDNMDAKK